MRNIESKFRCSDHEGVVLRALALGAKDEGFLQQRDQFYVVPSGRLKLRTYGDGRGELISYDREDTPDARPSEYFLHQTSDPSTLDEVLARALLRAGILEKSRRLLIQGNTRIHLDDVAGLGLFVELETVIDDQTQTDAEGEHDDVIRALGLGEMERISVGYVDLFRV